MNAQTIIRHFREMRPDLTITTTIVDATQRRQFVIKRRDATGAVPFDPCQCTVARCCRRQLDVAEALILTTSAYMLERHGRAHRVVKYMHDGQNVVKNTDAGGYPVWNTTITLRPPSPCRSVGAQTVAQKSAQPKTTKQSKEHVARRRASLLANPARVRVARVGILAGDVSRD
jgi:hypothetical protein